MTTPAINPHLTLTTYSKIRPGDRVVKWPLNPAHPDAHLLARTVAEIVRTYRDTGFAPNWRLPNGLLVDYHSNGCTYYDHTVIVWRDSNGSLFEDHADDTAYIAPAA
jgi:hypothetical protein